MQDSKFLVFRVYSEEERPEKSTQSIYYGWTTHKAVLKAFLRQRSSKKYKVIKLSNEEIEKYNQKYSDCDDLDDKEHMIDFIKLKSAKTYEEHTLFVTLNELRSFEIDVQGYFHDLASVSTIDGDSKYLDMVYNLREDYFNALYFLGYRPPEINALFSDNMESMYDNNNDIEDQIVTAYDEASSLTPKDFSIRSRNKLPGQYFMNDISNKILYSIESFMKIMKDDM